jgi:hypothetical protein
VFHDVVYGFLNDAIEDDEAFLHPTDSRSEESVAMGNTMASQSVVANPSASSRRLLPWLVAVAFFMESLDTTILNTAVPAISAALGVAPLSMKAVLASYTLSLAFLHQQLVFSRWALFSVACPATFICWLPAVSCRVAGAP